MKTGDLGTCLHPQLGIEIRERLVEQEHLRLAHQRSPERHTLALPTGELARAPTQVVTQAKHLCGLLHALFNFLPLDVPQLERERQVVIDVHVGIKGVVLKDHRNVAVFGRNVVDLARSQ